jgi:predicted oxidoreductase
MHHYQDININNLDCYIEKLIINKKIEKFGVSIYEENNIQYKNYINLMQLPANIFNQDLLRSKTILKFIQNGGTIHIRSIFIQGLILMNDKFISKKFHVLSEPIKKFKNLAKSNDVLPEELAVAVVKELCPLGIPVIGCDNLNQLKKLISIMSRNIDSKLIYKAIDLGKKYPSKLWDPRFW